MQRLLRELRRLYDAYDRFESDDGPMMAAAAAYFLGLSLFPLLTVLVAGVGWILASTSPGQDAEQQVMRAVERHVSPVVALQIQEMLGQVRENSVVSGPIGLAILLFTAMAGFSQLERAFERIWNVPRESDQGLMGALRWIVVNRLSALLLMFSLGGIVVLAFLAATLTAAIQTRTRDILPNPDAFWGLARTATSLGINLTAFTLLYRWLPRTTVPWKDAARGGLAAAAAWEGGRQILAEFLIGTRYSSAYGVVGTFLGVLAWCYYASVTLFLGAEYVRGFARERAAGEPSG